MAICVCLVMNSVDQFQFFGSKKLIKKCLVVTTYIFSDKTKMNILLHSVTVTVCGAVNLIVSCGFLLGWHDWMENDQRKRDFKHAKMV